MPQYLKDHAVYYAGPAKTPEGYASGSFGPTTAGRMDSYVSLFQSLGGSMVMLAKALILDKEILNPRIVLVTHSAAFLGFVYLTGARFTAQSCAGQAEGWDCLRAVLSAQAG